jgi:tetratricopeptide (TPR) repeat protein
MFDIKPISPEAIPLALDKAERYRLLNEPAEAESICRDVLAIDPENHPAVVMLLLTLSDQLRAGAVECFNEALELVPLLAGEYERLYYSGILWERRGHALALHGGPGSGQAAFEWVHKAMDYYDRAAHHRPPDNDDPILRWNACIRLCQRYHLHPEAEEKFQPLLGED